MKRVPLYILLAALSWFLLELACFAFFPFLIARKFNYASLKKTRQDRIAELKTKTAGPAAGTSLNQLHPYVGYTGRPGTQPPGPPRLPFNDYGIQSAHPYPFAKSENQFVIAVVGGSVAAGFASWGEPSLQAHLRKRNPRFEKKRIVMISLAMGGYKQPQQLFNLEYALLSGFTFDAVLNMDGFNDLVITVQNLQSGINPVFPSGHHMGFLSKLIARNMDPETVLLLSMLYEAYMDEMRLLSLIQRKPFRYSPFFNLLGIRWTKKNIQDVRKIELDLSGHYQKSISEEYRGPKLKDVDDPYDRAARLWAEASQMLHAICKAHDILYLHILQPNQYYAGSKKLSPNERRTAYSPEGTWGRIAARGYPLLVSYGKKLKERGVPLYDMTLIFKNEEGDIYVDDCCHFGIKGGDILAGAIADIISRQVIDERADRSGAVSAPGHLR